MAKIVSVEEEKSLIVVGHEEVEAEDQLEGADGRLMVEQGRSPGQTLTLRVTTRPVLLGALFLTGHGLWIGDSWNRRHLPLYCIHSTQCPKCNSNTID